MLAGGFGCSQPNPAPAAPPLAAAPASPASPATKGTPAATPASLSIKAQRPAFDGEKAFAHLQKQCDFGPRTLGSAAHEKCRDFLLAEMRKYADRTITQAFSYRNMPVTNIIGVFYPEGSEKPVAQPVLLTAHWDTRPIADGPFSEETRRGVAFRYGANGWHPTAPIPGANDGASGAAVLLELARLFKAKRPPVGVLILLNDGEDYGDFRARDGEGDGVFLGARYFARHFRDTPDFGRPDFGILLDMVGGKGLVLPRESLSQQYAPGVNEKVFGTAESLGYGRVFLSGETQAVEDDHIPLNMAGIPTIDLIHPLPIGNYETTGYRYWHTRQDTPDKCSAEALKIVGETVAEVVYRETPAR